MEGVETNDTASTDNSVAPLSENVNTQFSLSRDTASLDIPLIQKIKESYTIFKSQGSLNPTFAIVWFRRRSLSKRALRIDDDIVIFGIGLNPPGYFLINKREGDKAFTKNLFIKNLKIEADKAEQIINVLEKYNLLYKTQIEMDDELRTVYNFKPTPSFIAFLIFAREMIPSQ